MHNEGDDTVSPPVSFVVKFEKIEAGESKDDSVQKVDDDLLVEVHFEADNDDSRVSAQYGVERNLE